MKAYQGPIPPYRASLDEENAMQAKALPQDFEKRPELENCDILSVRSSIRQTNSNAKRKVICAEPQWKPVLLFPFESTNSDFS